jgi:CheY-like chemotaxis protein
LAKFAFLWQAAGLLASGRQRTTAAKAWTPTGHHLAAVGSSHNRCAPAAPVAECDVMTGVGNEPAVILIVDPDPLTLTAVAAVLDLSGYECHMARDPRGALQAARALPLDLVVCDVDLPDQSGFELCQAIRGVPNCEQLPFVFVSGRHSDQLVQRTRQAGGVYYLRKPYDPEVLLDLAERAIWLPHLVNARIEGAQQAQPHLPPAVPAPAEQSGRSDGSTRASASSPGN